MCDRSKMPHSLRTALCSARMPVGYCTGMSQPAKSTIRASNARWTACSDVFSSAAGSEGEPITEDARQQRRNPRELFGEEQDAHGDQQGTAEPLDGEQVGSNAAHHAQ